MDQPILPPGQRLAAPGKWPLVGERAPADRPGPWTLTITGLVERTGVWTPDELRARVQTDAVLDIHCVTRWSRLGVRFRGVPLAELLAEVGVRPGARFLSFVARSARGHSTSLPLADALELGTLLALEHEGAAIGLDHGGPIRPIVPGRYFYKSVKWLERIDVLAEDRLGHWEAESGYHNRADPWWEERYIAGNVDRRRAAELLEGRRLRGLELLSLVASGMSLCGLDAEEALLRNADFRGSSLCDARFRGANLSNARFDGADLRNATFAGADLEGASFSGADLRGADLTGVSLFGATFGPDRLDGRMDGEAPAPDDSGCLIDGSTRIDPATLDALSPAQRPWLSRERA